MPIFYTGWWKGLGAAPLGVFELTLALVSSEPEAPWIGKRVESYQLTVKRVTRVGTLVHGLPQLPFPVGGG